MDQGAAKVRHALSDREGCLPEWLEMPKLPELSQFSNAFSPDGEAMGAMMAQNEEIEKLTLNWCSMRAKGRPPDHGCTST